MSELLRMLADRHFMVYMSEPMEGNWLGPKPADQDSYPLEVLTPPDFNPSTMQVPPTTYCATLPMNAHHLLGRSYIPSRKFLQKHPKFEETQMWVGVDIDLLYAEPRSQDEFIAAVYEAFHDQQFYMADNPVESPCMDRGFWMEIRGYFPGPDFDSVVEAAKRHVTLLDKLISAGYITLGFMPQESD
ncbi:hypothetical protein N7540_002438 [Penicillium herquei]|nr:hypothetical protein N7540_002438 [Penicillium herquei]